jgi:hypothetical protein
MNSPLNDILDERNEVTEQEIMDAYKTSIDKARQHGVGIGMGGAPTRARSLPSDAKERKRFPLASGVLFYFPDALCAVAELSQIGNDQHNPGKPLHWDRSKSGDEADTLMRHLVQSGTRDKDGVRHSAKVAWRALALLQKEIEAELNAETDVPF